MAAEIKRIVPVALLLGGACLVAIIETAATDLDPLRPLARGTSAL